MYDSNYPAAGKELYYPITLTKVLTIFISVIFNKTPSSDDGAVRVRSYTTSSANFTNGLSTQSKPIFAGIIGF